MTKIIQLMKSSKSIKLVKNLIRRLCINYDRFKYKTSEFVIVSNNCWGGEIYKRLGLPYNTPFIGLFIQGTDYLKLLQNFDYYMSLDPKFSVGENVESVLTAKPLDYPLGMLGDIEIHFVHYKDSAEASEKWMRRKERMLRIMNKNKYYFKIDDRDSGSSSSDIITAFHGLKFTNKISFGVKDLRFNNHIQIIQYSNDITVPDGVVLYNLAFRKFDALAWIKSGKILSNRYSKLKSYIGIA